MKVTDKRMFTPEGELREEYRFIEEKSTEPEPAPPPNPPVDSRPSAPAAAPEPPAPAADPRLELPGSPLGGPSFYDLVSILAEPAAVYLGEAELPDGQSMENLEMARVYIDVLDVLRHKTAGNLTVQEKAFLEDLLYRLRVRYVQKRG